MDWRHFKGYKPNREASIVVRVPVTPFFSIFLDPRPPPSSLVFAQTDTADTLAIEYSMD